MRLLAILFLVAAPAAAEDLTPREGSGWAGFKPGSSVRMKRTVIQTGKMLTPTITTQTLAKADAKTLTLTVKSANALGVSTDDTQVLPAAGEAAPGETEKVEELGGEVVVAVGRSLECSRVRSTVTGPSGKRVITKWIAKEPRVWAKKTEVDYGPDGKEVAHSTMLLSSLAEERTVGTRKLKCLAYKTLWSSAGVDTTGVAYTSREIPGDLVWMETETRQGEAAITMRVEVLEFETK